MGKACGNPECGVSTGIHGALTFGSGELDPNGFWEHPCAKCARENERLYPEDGSCWPHAGPTRREMILASHHLLEDAKEEMNKALGLLKNLLDTLRDLHDLRFDHNRHLIEGEIADAVACARDDLGKVEIPEK
jgi:hypothetical protein